MGDAADGFFEAQHGVAQERCERTKERLHILIQFRPDHRLFVGATGRLLRCIYTHYDSFPITCSIFSRKVAAVNGLIR